MGAPDRFGAVLTAMATPPSLDSWPTTAATGWSWRGTTGESPVLWDEEKADLWHAVLEAVCP